MATTTKNLSEQEAIATILVNQRIMRNGSPPISNALDLLPQKLRDEVMDDAEAVMEGLKACRVPAGTSALTAPGQIVAVMALEVEYEEEGFEPEVDSVSVGGLVYLVPFETPGLLDGAIHATENRHFPTCAGCRWQIIRPLTVDEILEFTVHTDAYYYCYATWVGWGDWTVVSREDQL